LLYGALAVFVVWTRRHAFEKDRSAATFVAILVVMLPTAQVLRNSRLTYPFDQWTMYGNPSPPTTFLEFIVTDSQGEEYAYPFSRIAPASPRTFMIRLQQILVRCRCDRQDPLLDATIAALVRIQEQRARNSVTRLQIFERPVTRNRGSEPARRLRYEWETSGSRRSPQE
jgi:hypothetical protein